jgi:hypothetical protein
MNENLIKMLSSPDEESYHLAMIILSSDKRYVQNYIQVANDVLKNTEYVVFNDASRGYKAYEGDIIVQGKKQYFVRAITEDGYKVNEMSNIGDYHETYIQLGEPYQVLTIPFRHAKR